MSSSESLFDCEQALPLLARHRDGELPEREAGRVRRHLMDCPDCRREASEHRNLSRWFEHDLPTGAPAGFAAKVASLAQVGVVADGSVSGGGSQFTLEPQARVESPGVERLEQHLLLVIAACAVALIGLAIALGWQQQPASTSGLSAEPLPLVLEQLDALNAEQAAEDDAKDEDDDR